MKLGIRFLPSLFLLVSLLLPARASALGPVPMIVRTAAESPQQQPDPKKKEITATLLRNAEDETITLNAYFPDDAQALRVALYNMLGKQVQLHPVTSVEKGSYAFRFTTAGLPNGPYMVVLEAGGQRLVQKILLSR